MNWQIKDLPAVRGRYSSGVLLSTLTWFQVGGVADVIFRPADNIDLVDFLKAKHPEIPVKTLGRGSNLLVRDGGVRGVVVRLMGPFFNDIHVKPPFIEVGAGALDRTVALTARDAGLGGLEFLVGIPGTIGGALRMNAGAYGQEIKDVLVHAEAIDSSGGLHQLTPEGMNFSYRHCGIPQDWVFTRAVLRGEPRSVDQIETRLQKILTEREAAQPIKGRTGGSTFRNPEGMHAWELIDRAGCRGLKKGGAQVSEKHCNFLLNIDSACAKDIEELGEEVRKRVRETTGVDLSWEIIRWGEKA